MDLQDAGATAKYLLRDRDSKYTATFDAAFEDEGIANVKTGIRVPRVKAASSTSTNTPPELHG
jgi:putative transposase